MGIGDWGLGIGDWGLGPIPNPQSPIPNPHSPIPIFKIFNYFLIKLFSKLFLQFSIFFFVRGINIVKKSKYRHPT